MQRTSTFLYFLLLVIVTLACKGAGAGGAEGAKPYKSPKNDFTITFPAGSKPPVAQPDKSLGEQDVTYISANTDGTYKVRVIETSSTPSSTMETFLIGVGVFAPSEATTKETTFQNMPAMESRGWNMSNEVGGGTRFEVRLLAVKPPNVGKVFVIKMETPKKELLETKAANDFFNSFKLGTS